MKKQNLRMAAMHVLVLAGFSLLQGCATGNSPVCWLNWPYNTPDEDQFITPATDITGGDESFMPPMVEPIDMPAIDMPPPVIDTPVAPVTPAVPDHVYSVQKGDTLSGIASMYGTTWKKLSDYNSLTNPNKLFVNQEIRIPGTLSSSAQVRRRSAPTSTSTSTSGSAVTPYTGSNPIAQGSSYVIQRGDTLSGIAKRAGLSVAEIKEANALDDTMIVAGKSLSIPKSGEVSVPTPSVTPRTSTPSVTPSTTPTPQPMGLAPLDTLDAEPETVNEPELPSDVGPVDTSDSVPAYDHVVYPGETLDDVARQFSTTKEEIMILNGLTDENVKPSTRLLIPMSE